jgi:hypothetical protein
VVGNEVQDEFYTCMTLQRNCYLPEPLGFWSARMSVGLYAYTKVYAPLFCHYMRLLSVRVSSS